MTATIQKVFFDGEMRPVDVVAQLFLDNGKDRDYILRWLGFRLGLDQFDERKVTP